MFEHEILRMATDGVDGSSTTTSADLAELNDETTVEEAPEEVEYEEEEPEESEPEAEEPEQEQFADHPFERPSLRTINEAYPDFFKKFPAMRDMYFREAEYSKIFPTVEDAKEANENNSAFQNIRQDLFTGDGSRLLNAVKNQDPKALQRFAGSFLTTLLKVDNDSFWRAANPLVEDIARGMMQKGMYEQNESLQNAARYLSHYFFGNIEVAEGKKTTLQQEQPQSDVSKERETWENQKQMEFRGTIERDLRGQLNDAILGADPRTGRSKLDPNDVLSPFIRQTIIERVIADIGSTLQSDSNHIRYMDSLWDRARTNGRTDNDKDKIIQAYMSRARALAPQLRSKYVSEALGRRVRQASDKIRVSESIPGRTPNVGRTSRNGSANVNPKSIDYRKTSDYDILNDDIKYKQ